MKTLGKLLGGMMLAEGIALIIDPHGYLDLWNQEGFPAWMRKYVDEWKKMRPNALRVLGADMLIISSVMVALAHQKQE